MLTYYELIELRDKLTNEDISLEHAKKIFWSKFNEGEKAWHSKDWKDRRIKVLKDKCEICGSRETLTLQHLSHPKKYYEYERVVTRKYTQSLRESYTIINKSDFGEHIEKRYDYVPVPLCPNCKNKYPNKRKRKIPQYLCTECRYEFNEPIYMSVDELIDIFYKKEETAEVRDKCFISKDKWKNQHNLSQVKYWLQREKVKAKNDEIIKKDAFLLYLENNIKYLSFEDTITACKKCAYNFDINNMELCPKCKEYYKSIKYPTCIQCLPEEKRKAVLDSIEFGKEMQEMHKKLGID
jgi:ribosomal protein L37AE/L43A